MSRQAVFVISKMDCPAEERLIRSTCRLDRPDHGFWRGILASPLSTTTRVPATVNEDSARFVDRITLRPPSGLRARSCSSGDRSPCRGRRRVRCRSRNRGAAA